MKPGTTNLYCMEEKQNLATITHNAEKRQEWIPRDGDAILSNDGFIFYTMGYLHPPDRVISYLKYVPKKLADEFNLKWLPYEWNLGDINLVRPAKLYSPESYRHIVEVFKDNHPGYVVYDPSLRKELLTTPKARIRSVFEPRVSLEKLLWEEKREHVDELETAALKVIKHVSKATKISLDNFGVHGSISLGMHNSQSDIDIAVYGADNFSNVLRKMHDMCSEGGGLNLLEDTVFDVIRMNRFIWNEKRVVINAVRHVEEITEHFGDFAYEATRRHLSFKCEVAEDWESVFRPSIYGVSGYTPLDEESEVEESMVPSHVVSMIGEYRSIVTKSEEAKVSGSLERVADRRTGNIHHYRVIVGSGEQKPQDEFIWPSSRPLP
jgi:predicted nucleotidyltransferase